jgi:biopolymer transport protein ExbB
MNVVGRLPWVVAMVSLGLGCNALWGLGDLSYEGAGGTAGHGAGGSGGGGGTTSTTTTTATGAGGGGGEGGGGGAPWWNVSWSRRVRLSFAHGAGTENLIDFPVLVTLGPTDIDTSQVQAGGADLRMVDEDHTTELPIEIEEWTSGGASFLWTKVPQIDAGSDSDHIWLYFGNPDAPDEQDAASVWSAGFRAVWHLGEPAMDEDTASVHHDSTGQGNDGSQHHNQQVGVAAGSIGGAQQFDGTDDYITVSSAGLAITGSSLTLTARAKLADESNDFPHVLGAGQDGRYWQLYWIKTGITGGPGWAGRLRVGGWTDNITSTSGQLGAWTQLALVYDGAAVTLVLDGAAAGAVSTTGNLDGITTDIRIGGNPALFPRDFSGVIDEVRIADVARSPAWLAADAASQDGSLVQIGPVQSR